MYFEDLNSSLKENRHVTLNFRCKMCFNQNGMDLDEMKLPIAVRNQ